tara:strand:+ start:129 stop:533 length:405 start_codon:yes stop_codon:yes gene_type:complete
VKVKKKICDGCQKEQYIWKNQSGIRYCKQCWSRHKPSVNKKPNTVPIQAVSQKKKKKDEEYSKLRRRFLEEHSLCRIKITSQCSNTATDVHHMYSGNDRMTFYLIQSTWLPVCRNCHNWIHENPKKARIMNYLK